MLLEKQSMKLSKCGFTLIEILLVTVIIGVMLSVILPRAFRANKDAKFSQVRQHASEIASYATLWARNQAMAQRQGSNYLMTDFLLNAINPDVAGFQSNPLVNKYTGDDYFNGVEKLTPPEELPRNPFNSASYFNKVNDDTMVPSKNPGLLYFASAVDPAGNQNYRNFYLLFTNGDGNWYGQMDHNDPDAIRRGIFVARLANSKK